MVKKWYRGCDDYADVFEGVVDDFFWGIDFGCFEGDFEVVGICFTNLEGRLEDSKDCVVI